ncbi:MAG TPA: ABC transporter [Peptococcaceae bacterium]|nr:ABC transporter [Peptococcaceae bacterium]
MSLSVKLKKRYGDFLLDSEFECGNEVLALLGASGCGKSVTLRCIAGIDKPDEGRIVLDGRVLFDSEKKINLTPQARRAGYLFQQYALFPSMTVLQNVASGVREKDKSARDALVDDMIRRFQLQGLEALRPRQLSGGQQQRAALARIFASKPAAILLDEPFSALDSYLKWQLEMELFEMLKDYEGSILWISHDRGEVYRNCAKVCAMDAGRTEPVRPVEELFRDPITVSAARLSGCKNIVEAQPSNEWMTAEVPSWNRSLQCSKELPKTKFCLGIRAHHLRQASEKDVNPLVCTLRRITDDLFSVILMLQVHGAKEDAPLLRMEMPKELWSPQPCGSDLTLSIAPEDILILK